MTNAIVKISGKPSGGEAVSLEVNGIAIEHVLKKGETLEDAYRALREIVDVRCFGMHGGGKPYSAGVTPDGLQIASGWPGWDASVRASASGGLTVEVQ